MPKTEATLWKSLKQNLPNKTHAQRVENRSSQGMPDVYVCMDGVPFWLELKIIKNNRVSVSKSQIAWNLAHSRCGGVSFFLLHAPSTGDVFLFEGRHALEIHDSRIDDLCACGPAPLWHGPIRKLPAALRPAALSIWRAKPEQQPEV